jgi:FAD/FMN-containing dehydrogenase
MANTAFITGLKNSITGEVLDDPYTLGMYATDASIYQVKPVVVVIPKDEADVKKAVALANEHKITILPRGGGTSLAGQSIGKSMIMDFSKHLNNIIEINAAEKWVRVQPRWTWPAAWCRADGRAAAPRPWRSIRWCSTSRCGSAIR